MEQWCKIHSDLKSRIPPPGAYHGQIGITIRFNNHFWYECTGTLTAGASGGDNMATVCRIGKRRIKQCAENYGK